MQARFEVDPTPKSIDSALNSFLGKCQEPGIRIEGISIAQLSMAAELAGLEHILNESGQLEVRIPGDDEKDDLTFDYGRTYFLSPGGLIDRFENHYRDIDGRDIVAGVSFAYDSNRLKDRKVWSVVDGVEEEPQMHDWYDYSDGRPDDEFTSYTYTFLVTKDVSGKPYRTKERVIKRTFEERELGDHLRHILFLSGKPGFHEPIDIKGILDTAGKARVEIFLTEADNNTVIQVSKDWEAYGDLFKGKIILNRDGRIIEYWRLSFGGYDRETYAYDSEGRLIARTVYKRHANGEIEPITTAYSYLRGDQGNISSDRNPPGGNFPLN